MSKNCICCGKRNDFLGRLIPSWTLCHECDRFDDLEWMRPNKKKYYYYNGNLYYAYRDFLMKPCQVVGNSLVKFIDKNQNKVEKIIDQNLKEWASNGLLCVLTGAKSRFLGD